MAASNETPAPRRGGLLLQRLHMPHYYAKIKPTIHHAILFGAVFYADVMELVDMQDLGSCVARRVGSSPFIRTSMKRSVDIKSN